MGVVDGIDMILKYVWRCLLCLNKILANRPDLLYSQQVEVPFPASNGFQNFMQQCYICPRWYGWPSNWCSDVITLGTYKYKYTNTNTNTQIHKYTNTQIHKYTNTNSHIQIQIHKYKYKYTNIQIHKYKFPHTNTNTQIQIKIHKYTNTNSRVKAMLHRGEHQVRHFSIGTSPQLPCPDSAKSCSPERCSELEGQGAQALVAHRASSFQSSLWRCSKPWGCRVSWRAFEDAWRSCTCWSAPSRLAMLSSPPSRENNSHMAPIEVNQSSGDYPLVGEAWMPSP